MSDLAIGLTVLGLLCLLVAILPAKYDPAIRLKEWVERGRKNS